MLVPALAVERYADDGADLEHRAAALLCVPVVVGADHAAAGSDRRLVLPDLGEAGRALKRNFDDGARRCGRRLARSTEAGQLGHVLDLGDDGVGVHLRRPYQRLGRRLVAVPSPLRSWLRRANPLHTP